MLKIILRVSVLAIACVMLALLAVPLIPKDDAEMPPNEVPPVGDISTGAAPWGIVDTSKAEYMYSDMVDDLYQLAAKSDGRMTYKAVGETLDGRKIYAAVLGNPNAPKQVVISAGIHAREYMTPMLVMKQIEYYLYNYDTGEYGGVKFSELFEEYAFCILPMCNPDGIALVQGGVGAIRSESLRDTVLEIYENDRSTTSDFADMTVDEYLQYWKANARGVDLNRNFDTPAWDDNPVKRPCFTDCRGEEPFSEPETRAMADYVSTLSNPICSVAIHSRGEIIYFDCGQSDKTPALELARLLGEVNGYTVSYNPRSVAAFDDWCIINKNIPSVTVETGITTCPLPIGEFEKIWNDNRDLWVAIASSGKY